MSNGNGRITNRPAQPTPRRGVQLAYDAVVTAYIHDISERGRRPARPQPAAALAGERGPQPMLLIERQRASASERGASRAAA
jgi:hypothetical protein